MTNIKILEEIRDILMSKEAKSEYMTPNQVANYLNVSKSMVYKLGSLNLIPRYKPTHGLVYFKKKDIDAWIEAGLIYEPELSTNEMVIKALNKNSGR